MKKNRELKLQARRALTGRYGMATSITCLYLTFRAIIALSLTGSFTNNVFLYLLLEVLTILVAFSLEIIRVGFVKSYLDLAYGAPVRVETLFFGFKRENFGRFKVAAMYFALLPSACMLPANLVTFVLPKESRTIFWVTEGILISVGFFVNLYLQIVWSQAYFVGLDLADKKGQELIKLSSYLMQGKKVKYFGLQCSFIPLEILSIFTCGIGYFWIIPYMQTTYGTFYLNLASTKSSQ